MEVLSSFSLDLGERRFEAELRYGDSPFRDGPYLVTAAFSTARGSGSTGIPLTELLAEDYWGRCADGSLALLPHAAPDKGKCVPEASRYRLSASETAAFFAWLRQQLEGIASPGPRSRPSVLAG